MSDLTGNDNLVMFPASKNFKGFAPAKFESEQELDPLTTILENNLNDIPDFMPELSSDDLTGDLELEGDIDEEQLSLLTDSLDEQWERVKNFRPHTLREKLMVLDLKLELLAKIQRKSSFYLSETLTNLPENQQ